MIFASRDLLNRHIDESALRLSMEHGKTVPEAEGEIARGIEVVELVCGGRFNSRLKRVTSHWPSGIKEGTVFNVHSGHDTRD
ncbi:hypothetical protein [Pandoraea sp.]|uniref:hypothetical protein n=1 Tax=Pandoraea sp. TaxID=1883445 RepID=UPI0035B2AB65